MPPKKNEPSKKNVEKQKQKIVEDKTFGLKNKKGAKQQKFVQQVQKQVFQNKEADKNKVESKKEIKKKELEELNALFKPVIELQKIAQGVDPKSVLCVFFKQGQCSKGDRCKFSHDLNIERKTEKRNIYEAEEDTTNMNEWDQEKLEDVINKKHGDGNRGLPPTAIICKYFLEAVESNKYGWFWSCPTGEKCHYKHALPPGFLLKRDQKKLEEQKDEISLEELIENERAALGENLTKVTWETFMVWKRKKRSERIKKDKDDKDRREKDFKQGKQAGITGRELFEFNPNYIKEAAGEDEDFEDVYNRKENGEEEENEGPIKEINISDYYGDGFDEALFNAEDLDGLDEELENLQVDQ